MMRLWGEVHDVHVIALPAPTDEPEPMLVPFRSQDVKAIADTVGEGVVVRTIGNLSPSIFSEAYRIME